jgi:hypothetical protein
MQIPHGVVDMRNDLILIELLCWIVRKRVEPLFSMFHVLGQAGNIIFKSLPLFSSLFRNKYPDLKVPETVFSVAIPYIERVIPSLYAGSCYHSGLVA